MATVVGAGIDVYNEYLDSEDTLLASWTLTANPAPVILSVATYVLFVKQIGPAWMQKREPFDLRRAMFLYNMYLFFATIYFVSDAIILLLKEKEPGFCKMGSENSPLNIRIIEIGWWILFSKIVELFQTVCFVLRKKSNQITNTHVLHHALMPLFFWLSVRFERNGPMVYCCMINSMVHTLLYLYHGIASFGPSLQKYLWWKKYLTFLNIVHLLLIAACVIAAKVLNCQKTKFLDSLILFLCLLFLVLFLVYFQNTYNTKQSLRK